MPRTIAVVTVARSDYGHLRPLLAELRAASDVTLGVVVGGAHFSPRFGRTVAEIEADGWPIVGSVNVAADSDTPEAIATAAGAGLAGFAIAFARARPDIVVVLGDRLEMLTAAAAALPLGVAVAHVHGGEITEGAIDEQARHAITKLSHLHFAAAEPYAARIRRMGEEDWRVHAVGAPGLDRFRLVAPLTRAALARRLDVPLTPPVVVVTFHPETLAPDDVAGHVDELVAALKDVNGTIVASFPGADAGHATIVRRLESFAASRASVRLLASMGDDVYAALLREADVMVGNSSSGIIETPSFALPAVNIGARQAGRLRAANVVDVEHGRDAIAAGLARALDPAFRRALAGLTNPYGDGHAAPRIARVLRDVPLGPRLLRKKFVDRS
jgi:UDP-hydrolysing UDP-N-acetyl-D-glucosamine 2-epimerase